MQIIRTYATSCCNNNLLLLGSGSWVWWLLDLLAICSCCPSPPLELVLSCSSSWAGTALLLLGHGQLHRLDYITRWPFWWFGWLVIGMGFYELFLLFLSFWLWMDKCGGWCVRWWMNEAVLFCLLNFLYTAAPVAPWSTPLLSRGEWAALVLGTKLGMSQCRGCTSPVKLFGGLVLSTLGIDLCCHLYSLGSD